LSLSRRGCDIGFGATRVSIKTCDAHARDYWRSTPRLAVNAESYLIVDAVSWCQRRSCKHKHHLAQIWRHCAPRARLLPVMAEHPFGQPIENEPEEIRTAFTRLLATGPSRGQPGFPTPQEHPDYGPRGRVHLQSARSQPWTSPYTQLAEQQDCSIPFVYSGAAMHVAIQCDMHGAMYTNVRCNPRNLSAITTRRAVSLTLCSPRSLRIWLARGVAWPRRTAETEVRNAGGQRPKFNWLG
jgi:hypothetical protein